MGNTESRILYTTATGAITVIIPTRNEIENVIPLLDRIAILQGVPIAEAMFVDDSDDGTAEHAASLDGSYPFKVRAIHRSGDDRTGGLGGAVCVGLRAANTQFAVVMDGDLQHPPSVIPQLMAAVNRTGASLVVASRNIGDGSADGLGSTYRRLASKAATSLVRGVFPHRIGACSDPMSGFFMVERDAINFDKLQPEGFKILMELAVTSPQLRLTEVPFTFGDRFAGETKASLKEGIRYLRHVASLNKRTRNDVFSYQIHHHISVQSTVRLPELARFEVNELTGPADISVKTSWRPGKGLGKIDLRYKEIFGNLGFSVALESKDGRYNIEVGPALKASPHVLYTNVVEAVLRWALTERGYAMIHTASIEHDGIANLVTAQTDTGKTTTMLQLLKSGEFRFMADDLMIVNKEGDIWSYPKPLTISAHTLRAVNAARLGWFQRMMLPIQSRIHSRSGRKIAFSMAKTNILPIATINLVTQMTVPPPKYFVETLVEGVRTTQQAKVGQLYVIARGEKDERTLDPSETMTTLLANCEDAFGFPPYEDVSTYLRAQHGADLMDDYVAIVEAAIGGQSAIEFISNDYDWAESISSRVTTSTGAVVDIRDTQPTNAEVAAPEEIAPTSLHG